MTDKKENILHAALDLFANDGYNATSTSKIAKQAGVSEGLIFRHFDNKKGLLQAIVKDAEERIGKLLAPIIFEEKPEKVIRKIISMPFEVNPADYSYWKLQFKLKWEAEYNNPNKMKPLIDKLAWAFAERGYKEPEKEAVLLNQIIDAISTEILRDGRAAQEPFKDFLLEKYKV